MREPFSEFLRQRRQDGIQSEKEEGEAEGLSGRCLLGSTSMNWSNRLAENETEGWQGESKALEFHGHEFQIKVYEYIPRSPLFAILMQDF